MTTEKKDKLIDQLRIELGKVFELDSEIPEIKHFWVKLFGGCALLAVETSVITLLYYNVQLSYPLPIGMNLSLTELFFVSTILAIGINVAIAKIIYKIKKDQHHKTN